MPSPLAALLDGRTKTQTSFWMMGACSLCAAKGHSYWLFCVESRPVVLFVPATGLLSFPPIPVWYSHTVCWDLVSLWPGPVCAKLLLVWRNPWVGFHLGPEWVPHPQTRSPLGMVGDRHHSCKSVHTLSILLVGCRWGLGFLGLW